MAILSLAEFLTRSGISTSDATRDAALSAVLAEVDDAIRQRVYPYQPEGNTASSVVLDAPMSRDLLLPLVPVRAVSAVYLRYDAYGLATNFTSTYLLDNTGNAEYQLLVDDPVQNWSRSGILRRVGSSAWATGVVRYPYRLGDSYEGVRGAVMVSFTYGATSTPASLKTAAALVAAKLYAARKLGAVAQSESLNSYAYSIGASAAQFLDDPAVSSLLAPFSTVRIG